MSTVLDLRTIGNQTILIVDAAPGALLGTAAEVGSLAMWDNSGAGHLYLKVGVADTAWDEIAKNESIINTGDYRRLAIYNTNASGTSVDDTLADNGFAVDIAIEAQPARDVAIEYRVPNPGNLISAADFVLTEGNQLINGDKHFADNVIVDGDLTVNGDLTYINSVNLNVTDKFITLNKGGADNSSNGAGIGIEENNVIVASITVNDNLNGWLFKAPDVNYYGNFDFSLLTENHYYQWPDVSGIVAVMSATGTPGQVTWINSSFQIETENGVGNDSIHWDAANNRLGVATSTPARTLDVDGDSMFRGALRIEDGAANYEVLQAETTTSTNALKTMQTISIADNSVYLIEARVIGKRTDGIAGTAGDSATYIRTFKAKNVSGSVSISHYDSMYTSEDQTSWDVKASISDTDVLIRVAGATNNDISWQTTTIVQAQ